MLLIYYSVIIIQLLLKTSYFAKSNHYHCVLYDNLFSYSCLCPCAVRFAPLALGRLCKKEDLSAVMTVFHVQKEKSVMAQVK